MLVSELFDGINDSYRGQDDDRPAAGTEEYDYWLRTSLRIRRHLYRDTSKQWDATYAVADLGLITADATPTFDLSTLELEFLSPANVAYVIDTDGGRHDFRVIKPQEQVYGRQEVYVAGRNPQTLFFTKEILADDAIVGGRLYLPGYFMPADFAEEGDVVIVDDPDWLITATAAKLASIDLSYQDIAPDLNAEANAMYAQMVKNNRRGTYGNPRKSIYNVPRITTPDRR